ncbi:hypothetical protein Mycsm_01767 [Mycobacterium sp. JS623]|uniref:glycosyl hydrolase family 28-related protein n=1 Tax=Mycobacterium sp. JS623 TaxID=212767 RepID=UPI0002A590BF|nr:glycosyl hydrolase family 28-related protein [Mycobacterium sp. JS623]AGB22158.1 hypothetical protein Mycsm_01767 [Mycobacterium sp. JS623]
MARLPQPGGDSGTWGDVLNDYLSQAHKPDGLIKDNAVTANTIAPNSVTNTAIASDAVNATSIADGSITNALITDGTIQEAKLAVALQNKIDNPTIADATSSVKGKVQLAGDLGGTAASPTVTGLQGRSVNSSAPADGQVLSYSSAGSAWVPATVSSTTVNDATTSSKGIVQLSGDLGGTASAPTVPGLANKLDTSTAASTYAPKANPTFTGTVTVPTPTNGTDATTKAYVDSAAASGTPDATSSTKGKLQLAGDLAGTAASPQVAKIQGIAVSGTPISGQVLTASSGTAASWSAPASAPVTSVAGKTGAVTLASTDLTDLSIASPANGQVLTFDGTSSKWKNAAIVPAADATTTSKGIVQLAGDLGGTASAPTVPGLTAKEPTITAGTTSQYWRGDKSWQALDKTAVGLGNVDNTSDANKPVSTATQTALNGKVAKGELIFNVKDYGATGDGTTDDTAAINACVSAATTGTPKGAVFFPPGVFKITSMLNWIIPGLTVVGSGAAEPSQSSNQTVILQATSNTQILSIGGHHQNISGLVLRYQSQQPSTSTNAIGIGFGDNTSNGDVFMSRLTDITILYAAVGIRINPGVIDYAGIFSSVFENIHILGFSISGIDLQAANGTGGANATGVVFNNIYIHNNSGGTRQSATGYGLRLASWDEVVFNQLNIEHQIDGSGGIGLSNVGNAVFNSTHMEGLELTADGKPQVVISSSRAVFNGFSTRYSFFSGSGSNPVFKFLGTFGHLIVNGFNDASSTITTPSRPFIDFGTATGCYARINHGGNLGQTTTKTVGGDSSDTAIFDGDGAASALKLTTARNINGVAFDGTADITVADATKLQKTNNLSDVSNPALAQLGLGIAKKAGMVCDAQRVYGAAITSGSNVITLPAWAPAIQSSDIGKPCVITGAGAVIDASVQINTTSSSTSVTVTSGSWPSQILTNFQYPISGTGIPAGASITITSTTAGTLSANATATGTPTALLIARSQTLSQNQYAPLVGFIGAGSSGSTINLVTTSGGSTPANASQTVTASGSQNPSTFGSNAPTPVGTCIWGTDDTTAFQQAVYNAAALASSAGPAVSIPFVLPGRCVISSSILWQDSSGNPAHGVSLHGYGHKVSSIHVIGAPTQGAIQKAPSNQHFEGVTFADLEIDGSGHSATSYVVGYKGLAFDTGMHMRYRNLYVHDFPATGIAADDNVDTVGTACESANNGRLQNGFMPGGSGFGHAIDIFTQETASWVNCIARLNGNHGLFFENNTNTVVGSSRGASVIGGQYYLNWNDGISDSGAGSLTVIGVQLFQNTGDGFAVRGPSFTETGMNVGQQGLVSGCQIFRNGGSGINFKPTNTGGTGTPVYTGLYTFTGNRIWTNSSCGVRIQVGSASTMANISITDNDILTNVSPGILLNYFGSTGAVVTDLDIIGNRIIGNGTGNTAGSDDGITVNTSVTGLRIKTNTITGSKGYGVNIGAGYTSAVITGFSMFGNDFTGSAANTSGALSVNAGVTKTVWALRGNSGYNPVGSSVPGTAFALAASTVAWTNNTGVDVTLYVTAAGTVTAVSVNGVAVSGTLAVGDTYRIAAGGTFTATYSSAPTLVAVGD